MLATESRPAAGLPLVACFVQNGESPYWTPYAIRCSNAASKINPHPVVYLTRQFHDDQASSRYRCERDGQTRFDCPRCNTMSAGTLLSPEENPRPVRVELPVLHDSENAGHRALVAALKEHEWAKRSNYFARDLAYWTRQSLETHDAPEQWGVVVSECGLNLVARGQFQAPERLGGSIGAQSRFLLFLWNGAVLMEATAEIAMTWIVGENDNRHADYAALRAKEVTMSIPSEEELRGSLPYAIREKLGAWERQARQEGRWTLKEQHQYEVLNLILGARRCAVPYAQMSLFEHSGGRQWVCNFSLNDRDLPRTNDCNMHGQNVSQWRYAGALVVDAETGELSGHH